MHAVRQCSVCSCRAAAGLLRNQADVSPLRGAACTRLLSNSESVLFSSKNLGLHPLGEWKDIPHTSVASLNAGRRLCAVPFTQQVDNLSHDSLIKRAASVITDSSTTFLSQTTLALIDAITDYSKAVYTRVTLQRRYLASLGKLTPAEEDSFRQLIIGQRTEANERLDKCKRFESNWINAVNLSKMAAESAYTSGAEQASLTLRTNIQMAQAQVEEARKMSADADKMLAETKVEEIQRMAEYSSYLGSEEHEVHEAYLRED